MPCRAIPVPAGAAAASWSCARHVASSASVGTAPSRCPAPAAMGCRLRHAVPPNPIARVQESVQLKRCGDWRGRVGASSPSRSANTVVEWSSILLNPDQRDWSTSCAVGLLPCHIRRAEA